jgi:glycosyltransferase involved in cell wall biosynthesis
MAGGGTTSMLNVWLVNPFDPLPGEQLRAGRYAFFARILSEAGWKVTWWTSAFFHFTKTYRDPAAWEGSLPERVTVIPIRAPAYRQNVSTKRLINHFVWASRFFRVACEAKSAPDIVVASSPPLFGVNRAIRLARRRNAKVIVDVQDLWPEAFGLALPGSARSLGNVLLRPLEALADANYRQADGLTATCQTFLDRALSVSSTKEATRVIPLGVDLETYERAAHGGAGAWHKRDAEFWVAYVGTLGKTYDIETVLEVAHSLLRDEPGIRIFFAGGGPLLQASRDRARSWGLSNVTFTGILPLDLMAQLLVHADVGLNAVAAGAVPTIPNKFFDYAAAGLPIINSVKGELGTIIQQNGIGASYEAGQVESLRQAILTFYKTPGLCAEMGARAHQLAKEHYDRRIAYRALPEMVQELV